LITTHLPTPKGSKAELAKDSLNVAIMWKRKTGKVNYNAGTMLTECFRCDKSSHHVKAVISSQVAEIFLIVQEQRDRLSVFIAGKMKTKLKLTFTAITVF